VIIREHCYVDVACLSPTSKLNCVNLRNDALKEKSYLRLSRARLLAAMGAVKPAPFARAQSAAPMLSMKWKQAAIFIDFISCAMPHGH